MKKKIVELLSSTHRAGIGHLIEHMEYNGFFTAPCSGQYHLCKEGGLAEHSLNVANTMFANAWANKYILYKDPEECREFESEKYSNIIICGLLHDLGKIGHHGKPNYVPNKLKNGELSSTKPFETNKNLCYVPHEIESVAIASKFIELTEDEEFAILQHNGMYGDLKYSLKDKETPLQMLLHFSDMWASRVIERE